MNGARVAVGVGLALLACPAAAHDVGLDLDATSAISTADAPRLGAVGGTANAGFDFGDALSLFGAFAYHRELPTRIAEISAGGGDVFQLSVGALWFGANGLSALLGLQYSPASAIRSAATLRFRNPATDQVEGVAGVVANTTTSVGFTLGGGLASSASLLNAQVTATRYELGQRFTVPPTPRGEALAAHCVTNPASKPCPVVNGKSAALWQARLGLTWTVTPVADLQLGVEGAAYFFDSDPAAIGFFAVAVLERGADAGSGASAAYLVTVRPFAGYHFGRVGLRLSYQLGAYAADQGLAHLLSLRTTLEVNDRLSLGLTLSGQADTGATTAFGASAVLGATWTF